MRTTSKDIRLLACDDPRHDALVTTGLECPVCLLLDAIPIVAKDIEGRMSRHGPYDYNWDDMPGAVHTLIVTLLNREACRVVRQKQLDELKEVKL